MSLRRATTSLLRSPDRSRALAQRWLWQHRTLATTTTTVAAAASLGRSEGEQQHFRDGCAALLTGAGLSAASAVCLATHHDNNNNSKTKCEEHQKDEEEEPYDVFSSSDPMDLPTQSEDGIPWERILLTDIEPTKNVNQELQDEKSDFSKSMRAFGSCLESTAAIRRRDTPLATSKQEQTVTAEERISTLAAHHSSSNNSNNAANNETVTTRNMYFYKTSQIHHDLADKFVLLAGPSSEDLGGDIGHLLGVGVSRAEVAKFADG